MIQTCCASRIFDIMCFTVVGGFDAHNFPTNILYQRVRSYNISNLKQNNRNPYTMEAKLIKRPGKRMFVLASNNT